MMNINVATPFRRGARAKSAESFPLSVSLPAVLIEGSDYEFRRLIHRMILNEGRLVEIRKSFASKVGVTGAQYTMMMALLRLQGDTGIAIGALADFLEVTGPHVTGEVRKLAAKGYVRKCANPKDKRGVLISLTRQGKSRLLSAFAFIRSVNDILFQGVTAEEFRTIVRFNQKFMRNTALALDWIEREERPGGRRPVR
ncbi:MarR family winged helix-turn-helix transcriptional regulator [Pseudorhodoplanes sp.]|uniref:MarR family winged helix-turn-helix transcriptional regulator n=1 Tax=Pseudorhodoplanes sp. TaxID=1934341 RepID=UPI00391CBEB7